MEWANFYKAKEIDTQLDILGKAIDGKITVDSDSSFYPLYSILSMRPDFEEYLKNVSAQLIEKFKEL